MARSTVRRLHNELAFEACVVTAKLKKVSNKITEESEGCANIKKRLHGWAFAITVRNSSPGANVKSNDFSEILTADIRNVPTGWNLFRDP